MNTDIRALQALPENAVQDDAVAAYWPCSYTCAGGPDDTGCGARSN